jgi:hypothetical protein
MQRCDDAIATLGAERASIGAELGRVQEILAVAVRPATPPAGEAPIVPIESLAPPVAAPVAPSAAPPVAPPAPPPAPAAASSGSSHQSPPSRADAPSGFDELAFLQSVVDRPAPPPAPSAPMETYAPAPESRPESRSTPAHAPAHAPANRAPMMNDRDVDAPAPVNAAPSRRNLAPTPVLTSTPLIEKDGHDTTSTLTPGSIPAFLKDVPTEQIKTLKCQECGTMNYPTEWYCERCGGELAAM